MVTRQKQLSVTRLLTVHHGQSSVVRCCHKYGVLPASRLGSARPSCPHGETLGQVDSLGDTEVSDASGAAEDARTVLHGEPT
jgi:hypothetical protein